MNQTTFVIASAVLRTVSLIVALLFVTSWPRARGKSWLIAALSVWVAVSVLSTSNLILHKFFGGPGQSMMWIYRASNVAGIVAAILMMVAAIELKGCLQGRLQSTLKWNELSIPLTAMGAGLSVFVGMSMPWSYFGRHWVSGWASSLSIQFLYLPGFLVAFAAFVAAAVIVVNPSRQQTRWMPLACCGYGLVHTIMMAFAMLNTAGMKMGVGVWFCVLGFSVLSFCCVGRSECETEAVAAKQTLAT